MINANDWDRLVDEAKDLINWVRENDPDNGDDITIFETFKGNVGWEPWMEEYAHDEDHISDAENAEIDKVLRNIFDVAWKDTEYEEYVLVSESIEIRAVDLHERYMPRYLSASDIWEYYNQHCFDVYSEHVDGEYKTLEEAMAAFQKTAGDSRISGMGVRFIWATFSHVERARVFWDEYGNRTIELLDTVAHNVADFGEKDEDDEDSEDDE